MSKVLLLPLLNIPSGHHQAAEAVAGWLMELDPQLEIEKVELLSHFHPLLEKTITSSYLTWIHKSPRTYNWVYKQIAYRGNEKKDQKFTGYQLLFLKQMKGIIHDFNPNLILCSHALPSNLVSRLKMWKLIDIPVVNIYTDYFINNLWGKDGIDLHLVPAQEHKDELMAQGILSSRIIVTGIPVDPLFWSVGTTSTISYRGIESIIKPISRAKRASRYNLLVAGGSIGIGLADGMIEQMVHSSRIHYHVLCGKNIRLYERLSDMKLEHLTPIPYISNREQMNKLYERMDGIITKPGGVTISESLHKRLPIFVHSALPGQEQFNLNFLLQKGLVTFLDIKKGIEEQVYNVLNDQKIIEPWLERIELYIGSLELQRARMWMANKLNRNRS